jgi:hypothetical protein
MLYSKMGRRPEQLKKFAEEGPPKRLRWKEELASPLRLGLAHQFARRDVRKFSLSAEGLVSGRVVLF